MPESIFSLVTIVSAIGCGLVAGVFLSFSDFVMRSLNRSASPGRIEVMQNINREVFRTFFMVLLIGMSVISAILLVSVWPNINGTHSQLIFLGGAIYLLAVFAVTMLGNVPMNERLDQLDPESQEANAYWSIYYSRWTLFNHIRTLGSATAGVCFLLAAIFSQHI